MFLSSRMIGGGSWFEAACSPCCPPWAHIDRVQLEQSRNQLHNLSCPDLSFNLITLKSQGNKSSCEKRMTAFILQLEQPLLTSIWPMIWPHMSRVVMIRLHRISIIKKQYKSEKWAHVADIWMNLKNEESKQMVEESNYTITSRIRNRIYTETWKIKKR